jgi:hypothetical protein
MEKLEESQRLAAEQRRKRAEEQQQRAQMGHKADESAPAVVRDSDSTPASKPLCLLAFEDWCGRGDSNPHALASASPSSWCVCQFRHFREGCVTSG